MCVCVCKFTTSLGRVGKTRKLTLHPKNCFQLLIECMAVLFLHIRHGYSTERGRSNDDPFKNNRKTLRDMGAAIQW